MTVQHMIGFAPPLWLLGNHKMPTKGQGVCGSASNSSEWMRKPWCICIAWKRCRWSSLNMVCSTSHPLPLSWALVWVLVGDPQVIYHRITGWKGPQGSSDLPGHICWCFCCTWVALPERHIGWVYELLRWQVGRCCLEVNQELSLFKRK